MPTEIELRSEVLFPSIVYYYDLPSYLKTVTAVANEYLKKVHDSQQDQEAKFMSAMSDHFAHDERLAEFTQELSEVCHHILENTGCNMEIFRMVFTAMWAQEHNFLSNMEHHVHGFGDQLVGFYCLDAPKNGSRLIFHDPRPGKVQINLPARDHKTVTQSSDHIEYDLKPGRMFIAPAWLPHSFSRNLNENYATRFVHFNVTAQLVPPVNHVYQECRMQPPPEIV